jgi:hypothetical protein
MTDKTALASALNQIAEGIAALAIAIEAPGSAPAAVPPVKAAGGITPLPAPSSSDVCLVHGEPWKVVPAGISKAGKPYGAFAACPERGCKERPTPAWYAAHPLGGAA